MSTINDTNFDASDEEEDFNPDPELASADGDATTSHIEAADQTPAKLNGRANGAAGEEDEDNQNGDDEDEGAGGEDDDENDDDEDDDEEGITVSYEQTPL